jgi:hypothetical protein
MFAQKLGQPRVVRIGVVSCQEVVQSGGQSAAGDAKPVRADLLILKPMFQMEVERVNVVDNSVRPSDRLWRQSKRRWLAGRGRASMLPLADSLTDFYEMTLLPVENSDNLDGVH